MSNDDYSTRETAYDYPICILVVFRGNRLYPACYLLGSRAFTRSRDSRVNSHFAHFATFIRCYVMGNNIFPKLNFTQFGNQNVKILGKRLYAQSLKDAALLKVAQLNVFNFSGFGRYHGSSRNQLIVFNFSVFGRYHGSS